MFIDTRQLDSDSVIDACVCIVGGGVAGLTLALEFNQYEIRTCVIESGGFNPDDATRDLYRGESIGLPYKFSDECRSRFFGGSSNCWGGWCRPLEPEDFARRDWVRNSGWPFAASHLAPYYERSRSILRLGPNRFDTDFWVNAISAPEARKISFASDRVVDGISQFSPPVRFGTLYRDELAKSKNVTVYLHANVVDIETEGGPAVRVLKMRTLSGRAAKVKAKIFVLAAGGIENARLLLVSNNGRSAGLGNHNGLVGRFFMDHPCLYSGRIHFSETRTRNFLYDFKYHYHSMALAAHGTCVAAQFSLSPNVQAREQLLNARVCFASVLPGEESEAAEILRRTRKRFKKQKQPGHNLIRDVTTLSAHPIDAAMFGLAHYLDLRSLIRHSRFHATVEPIPEPDSRVMLSHKRDRLGMNRVKIDWRLGSLVKRTFDRTLAIIAEELSNTGLAEVTLDPSIESRGWPKTFQEEGSFHHMGTTRMHDSPKLGVVDSNCRVHGTNNLYVTGSSVFPTAGGNFPTMTIVALALRLSDHIVTEVLRQTVARSSVQNSNLGANRKYQVVLK